MQLGLSSMSSSSVLVIGEALVDQLPSGPVAGGAPFNVARSLAALGTGVRLITRIGADDAAGQLVRQSALKCRLPTNGTQLDTRHTTGVVTVDAHGSTHRFEIHGNAAWDYIDADQAVQTLYDMADQQAPAVVYFGTLAQRNTVSRASIRAVLERTSALRYLDLNLRAPFDGRDVVAESLQLTHWLKVNDDELAQLISWFIPTERTVTVDTRKPQNLEPVIAELAQRFGITRTILTLGAQGWASFDRVGKCDAHGPASSVVNVVDTVGAGDAFSAMALAALAAGQPLAGALHLASDYAGAICGQRGPMAGDDNFFEPWRRKLAGLAHAEAL